MHHTYIGNLYSQAEAWPEMERLTEEEKDGRTYRLSNPHDFFTYIEEWEGIEFCGYV